MRLNNARCWLKLCNTFFRIIFLIPFEMCGKISIVFKYKGWFLVFWLQIYILSYSCINSSKINNSSIQRNMWSLNFRSYLEKLWSTRLYHYFKKFINSFWCERWKTNLKSWFFFWVKMKIIIFNLNLITFFCVNWSIIDKTCCWLFFAKFFTNLFWAYHVIEI